MYPTLLALHSLTRWLVLASLLFAICHSFRSWKQGKPYTQSDNIVRLLTVTICHIQLVIGLVLYSISPLVRIFLNQFSSAVHQRQLRFFGMEHIFVMVASVILITFGSVKVTQKATGADRFKTMAIWFSAGLFLILTSIPWAFSPLVSRPWWRSF